MIYKTFSSLLYLKAVNVNVNSILCHNLITFEQVAVLSDGGQQRPPEVGVAVTGRQLQVLLLPET